MNEAVQIVMDDTSQLDTTTVSLLESLGHTLAKDVVSDINMPPFEKATMDGYALVANDVTSASRFNPVTLDLVEEIQAGMVPSKTVSAGQASRIMTGAPVPSGADAVIMVEDTAFENGVLQVFEPIEPGRNRVPLGEDVRKGQTVLTAPRRIRPPEVGILAALGQLEITVYRRPIVGVVATGDEIVEPGITPAQGQIRNSNGYTMATQVLRAEGTPRYLGIAGDTVENLERVMREGLDTCDVLLLSGGVSAGVYDLVQAVMHDEGVVVKFDRIRMKPGKPLTFGVCGQKLVFGLPGNPVSSLVGLELLVRPALRKMQAMSDCHRPRISAKLKSSFSQTPGREQFVPAFSEFVDGTWTTLWVGHHGSADLFSISNANSLFVVPPEVETLESGSDVDIVMLSEW
ncbi:MAG: gephyrin-like molybdotransferase Glp [Candidatus Latescibacterota bacterium]|nr:gephyrin-like molybdotransferase Glp [Candidatus Latescibacterota bacterium]